MFYCEKPTNQKNWKNLPPNIIHKKTHIGTYSKISLSLMFGLCDCYTSGPLQLESPRAVHLPYNMFFIYLQEIWLIPLFEKINVENIPNLRNSKKRGPKSSKWLYYLSFWTLRCLKQIHTPENAFLNVTLVRIYIFVDKSFIYKYLLILAIMKNKSKHTENIFLHTSVSISYTFISDTTVRFLIIYNWIREFSFSFYPW